MTVTLFHSDRSEFGDEQKHGLILPGLLIIKQRFELLLNTVCTVVINERAQFSRDRRTILREGGSM
jgi:hypothetical protein